MTTRRGFLGAMLAAMTAPYAMSNGVARGILMPGKPLVELPAPKAQGFTESEGGVLVPDNFAGPMLKLFTAAGILLAEIPLNQRQQALFDYGRSVAMDFTGQGGVIASGMAARYELDLSPERRVKGVVGIEGNLRLDNAALVTGQCITIPALGVLDHKRLNPMSDRHTLFDRKIITDGGGFNDV